VTFQVIKSIFSLQINLFKCSKVFVHSNLACTLKVVEDQLATTATPLSSQTFRDLTDLSTQDPEACEWLGQTF